MNTSGQGEFDAAGSPAVAAEEKKRLLDEELIGVVVESVESGEEWRRLAVGLGMDEDTIAFIENEGTDVSGQCRKILQLWREREEKQAFAGVVLQALRGLERKVVADKFDARFNE